MDYGVRGFVTFFFPIVSWEPNEVLVEIWF